MESALPRAAPAAPRRLPRSLGRYELVEALGGGMSEVYRARIADAIGPERPLVVKLAAQSVSDDPKASVRFLDEAKLALALSHGNITSAFEFGKADGRYFIVMEYVRGASVRQLVQSAKRLGLVIQVGAALTIGIEVARALQYAHTFVHPELGRMPLVHRDVNPGNVLVARDGQVKLTDFGIAHALGRDPGHGVIWGQAQYVAPELFDGSAASPAADLYALGAVLFTLLALRPPFPGVADEEVLEAVRRGPTPSVRELRATLPPEVDAAIAALLAGDLASRPSSAEEARRLLERSRDAVAPGFRTEDLAALVQELLGPESASGSSKAAALSEPTVPLAAARPLPARDPLEDVPRSVLPVPEMPVARGHRTASGIGPILAIAALVVAVGLVGWLWLRPAPRSPRGAGQEHPAATAVGTGPRAAAERQPPAARGAPSLGVAAPAQVPAPEQPPTPPASHARRIGRSPAEPAVITINSMPWSIVSVDGRRLSGHTPLRNVELPAGTHTFRFENPELRMRRVVTVTLSRGERRVVSAMLEPAEGDTR
ncbi:MAG: protein kinase [Deltaproteobacteria bacterium]|nr:protein kinase [Deltaproteobacteria bacterium]